MSGRGAARVTSRSLTWIAPCHGRTPTSFPGLPMEQNYQNYLPQHPTPSKSARTSTYLDRDTSVLKFQISFTLPVPRSRQARSLNVTVVRNVKDGSWRLLGHLTATLSPPEDASPQALSEDEPTNGIAITIGPSDVAGLPFRLPSPRACGLRLPRLTHSRSSSAIDFASMPRDESDKRVSAVCSETER